ncbi:MAG: TatD family hydrolase [Bacteroidaceae bacterium]|nr:TatD family hydrolase [Bacteroidaceae bacterium]
MLYVDFHTHQVPGRQDVVAVVDGRDTWGVHPWRADAEFVVPDLSTRLAIGECGLDALRGPAMEVQEAVFVRQVRLSEELGKPLIIHCVKALDRLLRLRREHPCQPWMLHGFRGKPQQLRSLIDAGLFVGFGYQHNEESLRICPASRLLLETDTDHVQDIAHLYENAARERGLEVTELAKMMLENYRTFFRKEPNQT